MDGITIQEQLNRLYTERQNLESELRSNDYKNVKNGEAERANKPLPYDPVELYEENQAKRDRINEIDEEIITLTSTSTSTIEHHNENINDDQDENPSDESEGTVAEEENPTTDVVGAVAEE